MLTNTALMQSVTQITNLGAWLLTYISKFINIEQGF